MKIYLLNPPYFPNFGRGARWQDVGRGGTLYYPIWLSYSTAVLEENHDTKLVDAPAFKWDLERVIKDLKSFNPAMVVIDSSFPSLNNDIHVAEAIKANVNKAQIIIVGPPSSQIPEIILKSHGVDIVARWEYDFTLKEIADRIVKNGSLDGVKGISYKNNGIIVHNPDRDLSTSSELDTIPFVSKVYKKYLKINDYFLGQSLYPEVQIFTGRGCPNNCTFCAWPQTLMGRKYRVRSISNVMDELEWIENNLSIKEVFFEDDTFTISKERVMEFCNVYKERGLNLTWSCNARANTLDLETMRAMKSTNCRLLIAGFESGNQTILNNIKKGISVEQIRTFTSSAKKAGLLVHGDFIIGLPGETKDTIATTRRFIKEIKPDILQVSVASPFPGTEFYDYCKKNNYLLTDDPNEYLDGMGHQKAIISYENLSNEDMVREADQILRKYYLSIGYIPLGLRQIFRKNGIDEFKRLLFSAKMFLGYIGDRS